MLKIVVKKFSSSTQFFKQFWHMLIGIDASRANLKEKTGVEWYSYNLIKEIIKLAPKEQFILYFREKPSEDFQNLPENFKIKILKSPFKRLWTQFRLSLEMLLNKVDLLFVPSAAIPLIHPQKTITTIHDLGFKKFPQAYSFFSRLYLDFSTRFVLKHCSKIIVPSELTKRELVEIYKANEKKILVIPHGYDQEIFKIIEDENKINEVLKKYKIEKPFFLYIGRLEEKKNISGLIEAFNKLTTYNLQPTTLILVGSKGYGYKKLKIKNLKLKIIELGYVEENNLPYLLNSCLAFVFPSFYEGFGLPILEAFACGAPVIASNIGSIKEIAQDSTLLVDSNNSKEIAQAMRGMIENVELRQELRKKGMERVKNFSWQKSAKETLTILTSH